MHNNDKKVIDLMEQIKNKKKEIAECKFIPETNCIIKIDKETININVLSKEELMLLACKLANIKQGQSYLIQSGYLDVRSERIEISGYDIIKWLNDISRKIKYIEIKEEKTKLLGMEKRLEDLLSSDKKIEMELNEIENVLK